MSIQKLRNVAAGHPFVGVGARPLAELSCGCRDWSGEVTGRPLVGLLGGKVEGRWPSLVLADEREGARPLAENISYIG